MDVSSTRFLERMISRPTLRCPKCQSYYVDQAQCESCGFRLHLDTLGEPLGPKSFYYQKKEFDDYYSYFGKQLPYAFRSSNDKKSYRLRLQRRFSVLLDYLLSDADAGTARRRIFWVEMRDLSAQLIEMEVRAKILVEQIEAHVGHSEYRIVSSELINHLVRLSEDSMRGDISTWLYDYRLFGVIRLSFVIAAGSLTLLTLFLALSAYQYVIGVQL